MYIFSIRVYVPWKQVWVFLKECQNGIHSSMFYSIHSVTHHPFFFFYMIIPINIQACWIFLHPKKIYPCLHIPRFATAPFIAKQNFLCSLSWQTLKELYRITSLLPHCNFLINSVHFLSPSFHYKVICQGHQIRLSTLHSHLTWSFGSMRHGW